MENRNDEIKRGIGGTGVDDSKGVKKPASPSIGSAPVSGYNAQSGKELGSETDYGTANLNSPTFGAGTHDGVTGRHGTRLDDSRDSFRSERQSKRSGGLRQTLRNLVGRFGNKRDRYGNTRSRYGESRI